MTPTQVVCTVSSSRPDYLARTLRSWSAVRGEPELTFSCEPGPPSSAEMCGQYGTVVRHDEHLGPVLNTAFALAFGFTEADFVICTEEDVVVSADVLEYFAWASGAYRDARDVAAVCAYSLAGSGDPATVTRQQAFSALCWGTWADRWEQMLSEWGGMPEMGNPDAWDRRLLARQVARGRRFIVPCASRSQHIGESGLNSSAGPDWYARTRAATFSEDHGPQAYREIVAVPGDMSGGCWI